MAANVSSSLANWSTTESSNSPAGTDTTDIDAEFRMIQTVVRKYLATKGADIASAATVDLSTATGNYVHVTGSTSVTSLGTVASGLRYLLVFDGALTFTHNATSLILPGAANITTAAGDRCEVVSLGSGNWRCLWYQKASGKAVIAPAFTDVTGTAAVTQGGTGLTSLTAGDILYASASNTLSALAKGTAGQVLLMNAGATAPEWGTSGLSAATQADQETGTSTTVAVTPGRQHFHPSAAKGGARFDGTATGTNAPTAGYNVTSITRNSTGNYTVNTALTFSASTAWWAVACGARSTNLTLSVTVKNFTATTFDIVTMDNSNNVIDIPMITFEFYGDL